MGISGAKDFVFGGGCIGLSSVRRPTPLGVPTDMLSVVKKVRPIKPGDLQSPYSIDMPAAAWVLGIANPQSIKRLGHFLTADCKSAGTPNGGRAYPALRNFFRSYPEGGSGALGICIYYVLSYISFSVIPLSHRYAGYSLVAGDCKSPEHKEVRSFF